jgi:hypothetical protein
MVAPQTAALQEAKDLTALRRELDCVYVQAVVVCLVLVAAYAYGREGMQLPGLGAYWWLPTLLRAAV